MRRLISLLALLLAALPAAAEKRDVDVPMPDGVKIKASYYPAAKPGPGVILLHMCNSNRTAWDGLAQKLSAAGLHVLTMDYRNFGESTGPRLADLPAGTRGAEQAKWGNDIDRVLRWFLEQPGVDKNRIGAGGGSCGVNQAVELSFRNKEIKSLVLLAGGISPDARAHLRRSAWLPVFASASADDGNALETMRFIMAFAKNPANQLAEYQTGGHGTEMFAPHPDLETKIVDFFSKTLRDAPEKAPPFSTAPSTTAVEKFWDALGETGGAAKARAIFDEERKKNPKAYLFPEAELNQVGYNWIGDGYPKDAITIFQMIVEAYPDSANAYDSLADGYEAAGDRESAVKYAEKCLEMLKTNPPQDPNFRNLVQQSAQDKLKRLKPAGSSGGSRPEEAKAEAQAAAPPRAAAPMPPMSEYWPKPIVLKVPGMDAVSVRKDIVYKSVANSDGSKLALKLDAYIPAGAGASDRFPVIVFISGGATSPDWREAGVYTSYGRLAAASGFVGVTFSKRYARGGAGVAEGAEDSLDAVAYVRSHNGELNVDPDRVAVWAYSAGGWMLTPFLRSRPSYIRALVGFYPLLDLTSQSASLPEAERLKLASLAPRANLTFAQYGCCVPPVFIARAGLDEIPGLNAGIEAFVKEARKEGNYVDVELMEHPDGRHGFDIFDDNDRSREIIRAALAFLRKSMGMFAAETK